MTTQTTTALLLMGGLLVTSVAAAQEPAPATAMAARFIDSEHGVSLEQAISRAIEIEPTLRAARTDVDAARGRRLQAALRPNPSISVERREEPTGPDNLTMAQVQWPLDLFRRSARVTVADREIALTEQSVDDRIRLLAHQVRSRYGAAAAAIREVAWADRAVELVSRQFALVRQRAEQGSVPPLERDQMEVELRRFEADRVLAVGRADAAVIELKKSVGLPTSASVQLRDTLETLVRPLMPQATVDAQQRDANPIEQRPDIRAADAQVRLAEARLGRAQAEGRVDVSLFGNYMRMDSAFPQNGFNDRGSVERVHGVFHYLSAGAMVTVPLWNRNQGEVAVARAEQAGASARLDTTRLAAEAEIGAAEARVRAASAALAITSATVRLAGKNLDVLRQAYELGRSTMTEVLAEQRRYLEVERADVDTMTAAYDAQVALLLAKGER